MPHFHPFSSDLRTAYAASIRPIDSKSKCDLASCFHHVHPKTPDMPFPEKGPCAQTGYCTALAEIDPQWVWIQLSEQISREMEEAEAQGVIA